MSKQGSIAAADKTDIKKEDKDKIIQDEVSATGQVMKYEANVWYSYKSWN